MNGTKVYRRFTELLEELEVGERQEDILSGYGVDNAAKLSDEQMQQIIDSLEGECANLRRSRSYPRPSRCEISNSTRRLRSQCLKLLTANPAAVDPRKRGLGLPNDWDIINPFVQHHAGATLNRLSDEELASFVGKLRKIRDSGWSYRPRSSASAPTKISSPVIVILSGGPKGVVN